MDESVFESACIDYLILSVSQPAAPQGYWIEAGSWAGVAA